MTINQGMFNDKVFKEWQEYGCRFGETLSLLSFINIFRIREKARFFTQEDIFFIISPALCQDLKKIPQFHPSYADSDKHYTWAGIDFFVSNNLPKDGEVRTCFAGLHSFFEDKSYKHLLIVGIKEKENKHED